MRRLLLILGFAVLAAGCEYDFPLKGYDGPDKLFVEMVWTGSDTTLLHIHTCIPTARSGDVKTVNTVLEELSVTSDGKSLKVEKFEDRENLYRVVGAVKPGGILKVCASAEGSDPVEGQCRIPSEPSVGKIKLSSYPDIDSGMYEIDVDLAGDVLREGERWAVSCTYRLHTWTTGIPASVMGDTDEESEMDVYVERYPSDEFSFAEEGASLLECDGYGRRLHIVCDDNGADGHLRFWIPRIESMHEVIHSEEWTDWVGTVHPGFDYTFDRTSSCTVRIYKVAGEMYNYIKAQDASENNVLALAGLAPAMFAYTNVKGGFGLVAGFTVGAQAEFECL